MAADLPGADLYQGSASGRRVRLERLLPRCRRGMGWLATECRSRCAACSWFWFSYKPCLKRAFALFGLLPTDYGLKRDGVLGGAYAGYNWQVGQTVLGIEGDVSYLGGRGSSTQALFYTFPGVPTLDGSTIQLTANDRWLASIRGRLGYAFDQVMIYATGGAAFTETRVGLNLMVPPQTGSLAALNATPSASINFSQDKTGYAAGAGIEWIFSPNWIGRLEYLHYGFGGVTGALPIVSDTCLVNTNCRFQAKLSDLNIDSVRVGISYKFGAPVVAKY
jgi:outer membrane immunogenic protein